MVMFKRKRSTGNYTKRKYTKRSYRRRGFYGGVSKRQFGKVARPELKNATYTSTAPLIVDDSAVTSQLFGAGISQGLSDTEQRVGNRLTQKFFSHNMLLYNPGDVGIVMRYVIWQPRSTFTTIALGVVNQINTKAFRILKQGWINVPAKWSKVTRLSYNLKNQVMTYPSDVSTEPVLTDRVYLTLVCSNGHRVNYQAQTKWWYADA